MELNFGTKFTVSYNFGGKNKVFQIFSSGILSNNDDFLLFPKVKYSTTSSGYK